MSLCRFLHLVGDALHRLLEPHHEQQQERRHADGDQREVPLEPEHEPQHHHDRQQVDEDAERRRRREVLDRGDVARDRRQERSRLLVVVERERQAMQVIVDAHAKVVSDPLADALGVIVVDVVGGRADCGDQDRGEPGQEREPHLVLRHRQIPQPAQPMRQRMAADHVVDDDLDRPRTREAHRRLHHHGGEHDRQPAPIRPYQVQDEARHAGALLLDARTGQRLRGTCRRCGRRAHGGWVRHCTTLPVGGASGNRGTARGGS